MPRKQTYSTTELGLLDAIHAEPRSDELPLVYADWLDDHGGQPRYAELIRHINRVVIPDKRISEGHGFVHESFATTGLKRFPLRAAQKWAIRPFRNQAAVGGRMQPLYLNDRRFWRGLPVVGLLSWTREHLDAANRLGSPRHSVHLTLNIQWNYPPGREGVWSEGVPAITLEEVFDHDIMERVHSVCFPRDAGFGAGNIAQVISALRASRFGTRVCRIEIESRSLPESRRIIEQIGRPDDVVWVR